MIGGKEMSLAEILKRLKNGEKVVCPACNKGILIPIGTDNATKAHSFKCDKCSELIIIN